MKIVLSRKGFDSGSGGGPSPILPDGRILSLPIPDGRLKTTYGEIAFDGVSLADLAHSMSKGRIRPSFPAHLDPDLVETSIPRGEGWKPTFGQTRTAQKHLENQGVGVGDLFLFFGWFRDVEMTSTGWRVKPNARDIHALFGWLQIGEILDLSEGSVEASRRYPWLARHPHIGRGVSPGNTIYIAREKLSLSGRNMELPGAGTFENLRPEIILTDQNFAGSRCNWLLPSFFDPKNGLSLSYHTDVARWEGAESGVRLRSVARGQEFVIDVKDSSEAINWVAGLIEDFGNS